MNIENDTIEDKILFKSEDYDVKLVPISEIKVKNRVRKDLGDIESLVRSIQENGLLQPVVISSDNVLIAGERRLTAMKRLGWKEILAVVKDIEKSV